MNKLDLTFGFFKKYLIVFILWLITIFSIPCISFAAEVLQITGPSDIQIGDHNRNYKVKMYCFNVDPLKQEDAYDWLRLNLPRHSKVNLLPKGSKDGVLIAKIISLKTKKDIASSMLEIGLGESNCYL